MVLLDWTGAMVLKTDLLERQDLGLTLWDMLDFNKKRPRDRGFLDQWKSLSKR